jgi:hypothetical protein
MRRHRALLDRRHFLKSCGSLVGGGIAAGSFGHLLEEQLEVLNVASAGSIRAMLDGPLKVAASQA